MSSFCSRCPNWRAIKSPPAPMNTTRERRTVATPPTPARTALSPARQVSLELTLYLGWPIIPNGRLKPPIDRAPTVLADGGPLLYLLPRQAGRTSQTQVYLEFFTNQMGNPVIPFADGALQHLLQAWGRHHAADGEPAPHARPQGVLRVAGPRRRHPRRRGPTTFASTYKNVLELFFKLVPRC